MKATINLRQQTPMWHFQADTAGCVLRATEVKPKLDKFLRTQEKLDKSWFVKGREDALDYKLWFVAPDGCPSELKSQHYPLFFGNMGGGQQKKLIFYKEAIEMHLFSLNDALIGCIKRHLFEFFATHSFGTRQDKGFGFFFPVEIDGIKKEDFDQAFGAHYQFEFNWESYDDKFQNSRNGPPYSSWEHKFVEMFMAIHYFHKLIRSGINERGRYYKSLMYHYARKKGLQWDKPTIRHHFQFYTKTYQSICGQLTPFHEDVFHKKNGEVKKKTYYSREGMKQEYRTNKKSNLLFRDALGLASEQQWMAYKDVISVKAEDEDFARFKSPILYRPVILEEEGKCRVYIHWDESSLTDLKAQFFTISHHPQKDRLEDPHPQDEISSLEQMQVYSEFSLKEYFDYISTYYEGLRKRYERDRRTRMGRGKQDNSYITGIFQLDQENFRAVITPNTPKP